MEKRPDFSKIKSYEEFSQYYWYREELQKICRELGIDANAENILKQFERIVNNTDIRKQMITDLKSADRLWRPDDFSVAERIANKIHDCI